MANRDIRLIFVLNLKTLTMELSTQTIIEILILTSSGATSSQRKLAVKELTEILRNYPDCTITLKQAEELENITARQITWLRSIFNFKLI